MKRIVKTLFFLLAAVNLSSCTYNIQPAAPNMPPTGEGTLLNCNILMLAPYEFVNREYLSPALEGAEIRFLVGPPATEAIESLLLSRFVQVEKRDVAGDGTLEFMRLMSGHQGTPLLIARPRFVRLDSSVGLNYTVEFGLALDIGGLSQPITAQGIGIGTEGIYGFLSQSDFQKAADEALSQAITSLATTLPETCK